MGSYVSKNYIFSIVAGCKWKCQFRIERQGKLVREVVIKTSFCNQLVPPSCFCLCTPPRLCLCFYIILPPSHLCCVHKPKTIPFILSTIVYLIHFIDHSPSLSYLPYLIILMLHCHSALIS